MRLITRKADLLRVILKYGDYERIRDEITMFIFPLCSRQGVDFVLAGRHIVVRSVSLPHKRLAEGFLGGLRLIISVATQNELEGYGEEISGRIADGPERFRLMG
jgi:hypothetical protein